MAEAQTYGAAKVLTAEALPFGEARALHASKIGSHLEGILALPALDAQGIKDDPRFKTLYEALESCEAIAGLTKQRPLQDPVLELRALSAPLLNLYRVTLPARKVLVDPSEPQSVRSTVAKCYTSSYDRLNGIFTVCAKLYRELGEIHDALYDGSNPVETNALSHALGTQREQLKDFARDLHLTLARTQVEAAGIPVMYKDHPRAQELCEQRQQMYLRRTEDLFDRTFAFAGTSA